MSTAVLDDAADDFFDKTKGRNRKSDKGNTERPADARITVEPVVWKPPGFFDAYFVTFLVFGIYSFEPT